MEMMSFAPEEFFFFGGGKRATWSPQISRYTNLEFLCITCTRLERHSVKCHEISLEDLEIYQDACNMYTLMRFFCTVTLMFSRR